MKYDIEESDVTELSPKEVAEQLMNSSLGRDEYIGDVRLEFNELYVDIHVIDEDPRLNGHLTRTDMFTICDIKDAFIAADYYCWAKNESGEDVLLCMGC